MELTVYNPQKSRLETIEVEFTNDNTTWFPHKSNGDISTITDYGGGMLIRKCDYTYAIWIYDVSRDDIGYDWKKAKRLLRQHKF
jgi:hypothetical protein